MSHLYWRRNPHVLYGSFTCVTCHAPNAQLLCNSCYLRPYCSNACAKKDWYTGGHEYSCNTDRLYPNVEWRDYSWLDTYDSYDSYDWYDSYDSYDSHGLCQPKPPCTTNRVYGWSVGGRSSAQTAESTIIAAQEEKEAAAREEFRQLVALMTGRPRASRMPSQIEKNKADDYVLGIIDPTRLLAFVQFIMAGGGDSAGDGAAISPLVERRLKNMFAAEQRFAFLQKSYLLSDKTKSAVARLIERQQEVRKSLNALDILAFIRFYRRLVFLQPAQTLLVLNALRYFLIENGMDDVTQLGKVTDKELKAAALTFLDTYAPDAPPVVRQLFSSREYMLERDRLRLVRDVQNLAWGKKVARAQRGANPDEISRRVYGGSLVTVHLRRLSRRIQRAIEIVDATDSTLLKTSMEAMQSLPFESLSFEIQLRNGIQNTESPESSAVVARSVSSLIYSALVYTYVYRRDRNFRSALIAFLGPSDAGMGRVVDATLFYAVMDARLFKRVSVPFDSVAYFSRLLALAVWTPNANAVTIAAIMRQRINRDALVLYPERDFAFDLANSISNRVTSSMGLIAFYRTLQAIFVRHVQDNYAFYGWDNPDDVIIADRPTFGKAPRKGFGGGQAPRAEAAKAPRKSFGGKKPRPVRPPDVM